MASATGIPERVSSEEAIAHDGVEQQAVAHNRVETEPLLGKPGDAMLPDSASIMQSYFIGMFILPIPIPIHFFSCVLLFPDQRRKRTLASKQLALGAYIYATPMCSAMCSAMSTHTSPYNNGRGNQLWEETNTSRLTVLSPLLGTGIVAELGIIILCLNIWAHIWMNPVIFFSGHPIAMTIALFILVQSILTLQPISTPRQKRLGQYIHASLNLAAFAGLVTGAVIIEVNKVRGRGPHFHSLHAYVGVITLLLITGQYLVGFTMWATPGLYGGVDNAKKLYKYHRYGGYVVLVLLLTAVCTAMKTDYVAGVLGIGVWGVVVSAVLVLVGVLPRIQKQKLGLGVRRSVGANERDGASPEGGHN